MILLQCRQIVHVQMQIGQIGVLFECILGQIFQSILGEISNIQKEHIKKMHLGALQSRAESISEFYGDHSIK